MKLAHNVFIGSSPTYFDPWYCESKVVSGVLDNYLFISVHLRK